MCCNDKPKLLLKSRSVYNAQDGEDDGQKRMLVVDFGYLHNLQLTNLSDYYVIIRNHIPTGAEVFPVHFKIDQKIRPVMTNSGNNFMMDQLEQDKVYKVIYGHNPQHFLVVDTLPDTSVGAAEK